MGIGKILLIHTAPKPKLAGTDAVYNETKSLLHRYSGSEMSIFPFRKPNSFFPRKLYGINKIRMLRKVQQGLMLNHVFSPSLYYYPVLEVLTKPIVYTVTASIRRRDVDKGHKKLKNLRHIIVSNRRDLDYLLERDFSNVSLVLPGMELQDFKTERLPIGKKFVILMASAPWELSQFESKGINRLLETLHQMPRVELVLLWRGILKDELMLKIKDYGVDKQVRVIDHFVEIKGILKNVHATVLLVKSADVVKAYPHSLIESLASGKPVLLSREIAMSEYVDDQGCGIVVENFAHSKMALEKLIDDYAEISGKARLVGGSDFLVGRMVDDLNKIYEKIAQD